MTFYRLTDHGIEPVPTTTYSSLGLRERDDLQRVIRDHVDAIAPDTLVIAEEFNQWDTSRLRIDLLAVDRDANLVVIELKRDETGAHMELQALRYAAMVGRMTFEQAARVFGDYLAQRGRDTDARSVLLSFLQWDEPDETAFAQDVRIVLVSADFSRELTSTVMWLNERDLDIRCVQLRPHRFGSEVFLDVRQVIPLPEASQYQVQVREKARQERAGRSGDTRDLTRYTVAVYGERFPALRKRRAVLRVVQSLCNHGIHPDDLVPHLEHRQPFVRTEGTLTSAAFEAWMDAENARGAGPRTRYFLTKDEDLIHIDNATFALSKGWRTNTVPSLRGLRDAFPEAAISFEPTSVEDEDDDAD
jgi:hypothetical protein